MARPSRPKNRMNKLLLLFLSAISLAVAVSGCGPGSSPTATLPPSTVTPLPPTVTPLPPTPTEPPVDLPDLLARLHWLGRASFRLDGPPTIYFDPVLSSGGEHPQADVILISHTHSDHYSPSTLKRISKPGTVIVTNPLGAKAAQADVVPGQVRALRPGERTTVGKVLIEAVPAYNIGKSYHPKEAETLGFIVTLYGRRIYFAGDTDLIPEMADIRADVALLPVGGTYTMDAKEAAQAAAIINPKVAVPMHNELGADLEQFRSLCKCEVLIMKIE